MQNDYKNRWAVGAAALVAGWLALAPGEAGAVPSFARKYETSCTTCHTVYPVLNAFGEAFRRNGYRFPSTNGSTDGDATLAAPIALGQPEYAKQFPDAVWPGKIMQAVPLSLWINAGTGVNLSSDLANEAGHRVALNDLIGEMHVFGAGAFDDKLTYFAQITLAEGAAELETAYLLWNDVLGQGNHALNLWVGRLMSPSLTSFGGFSSYLNDTARPIISIAGLLNPSGGWMPGFGLNDGVELNGVIAHRVHWSLGWLASLSSEGLKAPDAQGFYAHVGFKLGGMTLDGEGPGGSLVADAKRPWEETALTVDLFAHHTVQVLDARTGDMPEPQEDAINAIGADVRVNWGSLVVNAGLQYEAHSRPFAGTAGTSTTPGTPDTRSSHGITQFNEIDYVVFPWLVPGVRTELALLPDSADAAGQSASLLRIKPGVALLVRPNIKVVVTGDLELAKHVPPSGSWEAAGGLSAPTGADSTFTAERINVDAAWAF